MTAERGAFSLRSSTCSPPAAVLPWLEQQPGWNEPDNALCDAARPHQSRRRSCNTRRNNQRSTGRRSWTTAQTFLFALVFGIIYCCQGARAYHVDYMAQGSELLFDRSEPPARPMLLHARQETTTSLPASIAAPTSNGQSSATATASGSGIATATPTGQASLPTPFDSSMGNNFTTPSCPAFFQSFLTNDTFKDCTPLSLLLQTSNGFFSAERSLVRLTQTLDASCNVDFGTCSSLMASLAQEIQLQSNCGQDLQMENPMVLQAYNGFVAYQPLYHAGCLTDSEGDYCFANAVMNSSAPTSSYIYYLPLGVQLPAGTQPTCNSCLQNTMAIFATAAGNSSVPLNNDYTSAAQQVDMACGPEFVEDSVEMKSAAAISFTAQPFGIGSLSLLLLLCSFLA